MAHTKKTSPAGSLKIGDNVASNVPAFNWRGVVIRDYGALGVDGKQIVTVRVENREVCRRFDVSAESVDRVPAERKFDIVMVAEPEGGSPQVRPATFTTHPPHIRLGPLMA